MASAFDAVNAVLVIAFGGPNGPDDVRPFLANVLRGRRVPPDRVDEVAHHYELFGGVSPITDLTRRQADGLAKRLAANGTPLPVYVGMRNWHPYLADTLAEMSRAGVRTAVGFIAAAHRSYASDSQYRENVAAAREAVRQQGLPDVDITYVPGWHTHPDFVAAVADNVAAAIARLPEDLRDRAEIVFTAHSIPESMPGQAEYRAQFEESSRLVRDRVARDVGRASEHATGDARLKPRTTLPFACVYQSRSGRPEDPWLGPDVCEYLRETHAHGTPAVVLCPIGFVCDHIEVLYDLDVEAAAVAKEIGLPLVRAAAVNDHPRFLDMMAAVVRPLLHP
jgi:ferrochelatase